MKYQYNFSIIDEKHRKATFNANKRISKARTILAILNDYSNIGLKKLRCLDIGCAAGFGVKELGKEFKEVVGIDIDKSAITFAKQNIKGNNLKFVLAKGLDYPFPDKSFDVIICNQIYEHVPNPKKLIAEISRLLKKGGFCYFGACNKYYPLEPHYNLLFLSYLPKKLANIYLKIFKGQPEYYENCYSLWEIRKLIKIFQVKDYTLEVIKNPENFNMEYMVKKGSLITYMPKLLLKLFYFLFPSYIFILIKNEE